jgi:hypothetical protein
MILNTDNIIPRMYDGPFSKHWELDNKAFLIPEYPMMWSFSIKAGNRQTFGTRVIVGKWWNTRLIFLNSKVQPKPLLLTENTKSIVIEFLVLVYPYMI